MAFYPDGSVLAGGAGSAGVQLREVRTGRLVRTIETPTAAVAFRPDGAMLATADTLNGAIRLWDLASGSPSR
jgi:WD40 repeat protein